MSTLYSIRCKQVFWDIFWKQINVHVTKHYVFTTFKARQVLCSGIQKRSVGDPGYCDPFFEYISQDKWCEPCRSDPHQLFASRRWLVYLLYATSREIGFSSGIPANWEAKTRDGYQHTAHQRDWKTLVRAPALSGQDHHWLPAKNLYGLDSVIQGFIIEKITFFNVLIKICPLFKMASEYSWIIFNDISIIQ